ANVRAPPNSPGKVGTNAISASHDGNDASVVQFSRTSWNGGVASTATTETSGLDLVKVTLRCWPTITTGCAPNRRFEVVIFETPGAFAVPLRATRCTLSIESSVMVSVEDSAPGNVGANATEN